MSRAINGSVATTYEAVDENDAVTASIECRIHFTYRPGDPGCMYQRNGDPGWPPEPPEVEFNFLEVERVNPENARMVWARYPGPVPGRVDLNEWARDWLDEHPDEVERALPDDGPDPDDLRDAALERAMEGCL